MVVCFFAAMSASVLKGLGGLPWQSAWSSAAQWGPLMRDPASLQARTCEAAHTHTYLKVILATQTRISLALEFTCYDIWRQENLEKVLRYWPEFVSTIEGEIAEGVV